MKSCLDLMITISLLFEGTIVTKSTSSNLSCRVDKTAQTSLDLASLQSQTQNTCVKILFDSIASLDPTTLNVDNIVTKAYLSMLLATFEEMSLF